MNQRSQQGGSSLADWMQQKAEESLADPAPNVSHAQVMADVQAVENGGMTGISGDLAITELLVKPLRDNDGKVAARAKGIQGVWLGDWVSVHD